MTASLELQKAINTALTAHGYTVYDFRPDLSAQYPFILIGDDTQKDLDVKNADHIEVTSTIMAFDDYKGNLHIKNILQDIREHCLNLILTTYSILSAKVIHSSTSYDSTAQCNQGVIEILYKLLR